jgi:hypothetical protein
MKQSALEFLESKMTDYIQRLYKSEIEQAKEMEKEQIIDAFKNGDCNGTFETINAEQYYNETFNK